MLAAVCSAAVLGIDAYDVLVEVDVAIGLPMWTIVGLTAGAVEASRERVSAAVVYTTRQETQLRGGRILSIPIPTALEERERPDPQKPAYRATPDVLSGAGGEEAPAEGSRELEDYHEERASTQTFTR
jgi:hypothetical protein